MVKFPRHQRPGLGRRMEEASFDLLSSLVKARYLHAQEKAVALAQASSSLEALRLLVRMSADLAYLPTNRYEELSRSLRDIGRMLGGWQKSVGGPTRPIS